VNAALAARRRPPRSTRRADTHVISWRACRRHGRRQRALDLRDEAPRGVPRKSRPPWHLPCRTTGDRRCRTRALCLAAPSPTGCRPMGERPLIAPRVARPSVGVVRPAVSRPARRERRLFMTATATQPRSGVPGCPPLGTRPRHSVGSARGSLSTRGMTSTTTRECDAPLDKPAEVPVMNAPRATDDSSHVLLTPGEVAVLLRTSRKAIYALIERGQVPGVIRIGRRVLLRQRDLLHWLDHNCAPSPRR